MTNIREQLHHFVAQLDRLEHSDSKVSHLVALGVICKDVADVVIQCRERRHFFMTVNRSLVPLEALCKFAADLDADGEQILIGIQEPMPTSPPRTGLKNPEAEAAYRDELTEYHKRVAHYWGFEEIADRFAECGYLAQVSCEYDGYSLDELRSMRGEPTFNVLDAEERHGERGRHWVGELIGTWPPDFLDFDGRFDRLMNEKPGLSERLESLAELFNWNPQIPKTTAASQKWDDASTPSSKGQVQVDNGFCAATDEGMPKVDGTDDWPNWLQGLKGSG